MGAGDGNFDLFKQACKGDEGLAENVTLVGDANMEMHSEDGDGMGEAVLDLINRRGRPVQVASAARAAGKRGKPPKRPAGATRRVRPRAKPKLKRKASLKF